MKRRELIPGLFSLFLIITLANNLQAASEWDGVKPDELGITTSEFEMVKAKGISKQKLMELLEIGILPSEYFSEPWKKLGVTESHWYAEKKAGMADDDIDQSYRRQETNNFDPAISLFLPGYFQYKTGRPLYGATLTSIFILGTTLTFVHKDATDNIIPAYPIFAVAAMFWSFGDALMATRYGDNPEAKRYSIFTNLAPGQASAILHYQF